MIFNVTPDQIKRWTTDFADLTASKVNGPIAWMNESTQLQVPFDVDPSPAEQAAILRRWATETVNEETVQVAAANALAALRTIRDSSGDLTVTQLSNAVRVLAKVEIGLIRLALRELDATN